VTYVSTALETDIEPKVTGDRTSNNRTQIEYSCTKRTYILPKPKLNIFKEKIKTKQSKDEVPLVPERKYSKKLLSMITSI